MFGRSARKPSEARAGERYSIAVPASVRLPAGERLPVQIEDLSASGFRALVHGRLPQPGMLLRVSLPTGRSPHARIIWVENDRIGCAFLANLDPDDLALIME